MSNVSSIYLFDIDGTLSKDGILPDSAVLGIRLLREKGNLVLLATGRCLGQMDKLLKRIEADGAILNNGALVMLHGRIIYASPIAKETIFRLLKKYHVALLTKDRYIRVEEHEIFERFASYFSIPLAELRDISYIEEEPVYSIGIYTDLPSEVDFSLYPDLRFVKVCPIGFDGMNRQIHKDSGLSAIRALYPGQSVIAFGDNYNDIEMLQAADIAVAMAQAPAQVKAYADIIAKDVLDDGIYQVLKNELKSI